jgi:hypothetical protein
MTTEQKKKLLKAKIAVALHDELSRVPKKEEIEQMFLCARVLYKRAYFTTNASYSQLPDFL